MLLSKCKKLITQAELDQQRILREASDTTNLNLQNELQTTSTQISEYRSELELFVAEIQKYSQDVNKAIAEFTAQIQQYNAQTANYANLYTQLKEELRFIVGRI